MRLTMPLFALVWAVGCGGSEPVAEPAPEPAPVEQPAPEPTPPDATPAGAETPEPNANGEVTPASLYASCEQRVEGAQADGECTTDADCKKGGCAGEVCTTAASAETTSGICDVLPCFAVLDTCGCHEGRCTWTLKDAVPTSANPKPAPLPPAPLPPSPPPEDPG